MPDPSEKRFILRESVAVNSVKKEYPIYGAKSHTEVNMVKLQRMGVHEAQLCISAKDAKKILETTNLGLELIIKDNSRESAGEPVVEIRLFPMIPYRVEHIDSSVVKMQFRVGAYNSGDLAFPQTVWNTMTDAELVYDAVAVTNAAQDTSLVMEYSTSENIDPTDNVFARYGGFTLHSSVPNDVKLAAKVGVHHYVRVNSHIDRLRMLAAITGTVWWRDLENGTYRIALAGADQAGLDTVLDKRYIVKDREKLETKWNIPYIMQFGFNYRTSITQTSLTNTPQRYVAPGLGLTTPTFYQPSLVPPVGGIGFSHFSTLVLGGLNISTLVGIGAVNAQAQIDAQAQTWERAFKAAERTVAGYVRASRRTDKYLMGGYFNVPLGSEVHRVTYKKGTTLIEMRDETVPLWPRIPFSNVPTLHLCNVMITQKIVDKLFVGSVTAPHTGAWAPYMLGASQTPIQIEDTLGLYPWLDVGDTVLAMYDGTRGVVLNVGLAADVELQ